ncbi:MAG TPA: hypothetical protein VLC92_15705 [Rhodocyclaceae bacterium]|nr:hypothetical protein [Rhodocyclaceae bacterium]
MSQAQPPAPAQVIACHYTYGGQTKLLEAHPVASPYAVPKIQVGSYFLLRAVWQAEPAAHAAVNIYTYADNSDGPVIIHQASFSWPLPRNGRYGFTGLQRVYEPMRDGELLYWCELRSLDTGKSKP